jgi:hypothetical protein
MAKLMATILAGCAAHGASTAGRWLIMPPKARSWSIAVPGALNPQARLVPEPRTAPSREAARVVEFEKPPSALLGTC